ncbi:hypothetical protein HK405_009337 [Cladochytrium tenue]|nr:hypothetical protein HK405_009337 [Cladochytrium tenue]
MPVHLLVVGGGACGAFHAAALHGDGTGPARVSVVCRSNYAAVVAAGGFTIDHRDHGPPRLFRPHAVFPDVAAAAASGLPFAHVLVFTKATVDTAALLEPLLVSPHAALRSISLWQNGLGIEDSLARRLADAGLAQPTRVSIVSVVMYVGMSLDGPTTVRAAPVQRAVLGLYPYGDSSAAVTAADEANLAALVSILHDVGKLDIRTVSQVQGARWQKCLWNATFGLLGLAAGGVDSQALVEDPSAMAVVRRLAAEVSGAAERVLGRPLSTETDGGPDFEALVGITQGLGPYRASIILDWDAGRDMETEVLFGEVIRRGRAHGAHVDILEALYVSVKLMEARRAQLKSTKS